MSTGTVSQNVSYIGAGYGRGAKERQLRERGIERESLDHDARVCPAQNDSGAGGDDDELGCQAEHEARENAPHRDVPRQLSSDSEELPDDAEDRSGRERETTDEEVGTRDAVADDGAEECRPPSDEPGQQEPAPGGSDVGGRQWADDPEPLGRVVQPEPDD